MRHYTSRSYVALPKKVVRQRNLWVVFEVLRRMLLELGCVVEYARRGQATCPQDEPVDSRYAVRDLTTAPRRFAFGLVCLSLGSLE